MSGCSGCLGAVMPYGPTMEVGYGVPWLKTPLGDRLIATLPWTKLAYPAYDGVTG